MWRPRRDHVPLPLPSSEEQEEEEEERGGVGWEFALIPSRPEERGVDREDASVAPSAHSTGAQPESQSSAPPREPH